MTEIFPDYYNKFNCIADKCRHNCCIGWEIDIDEETFKLYHSLEDDFGEKIRNNIDGEIPHFVLTKDERCPFLNDNGLCDIISNYGEDYICDICYLHPRFKNFYSDFTETGLGLCCEEAVRIILSEKEKVFIEIPNEVLLTETEKEFLKLRQQIFEILQNRNKSIFERFKTLSEMFDIDFTYDKVELFNMYLSLERLDEKWTDILNNVKKYDFNESIFKNEDFDIVFEQLSVYFIFRYLNFGIEKRDFKSEVKFSLISCYFLGMLFECFCSDKFDFEKIVDIVRMYSSEIEYSEENIERIFNIKGL